MLDSLYWLNTVPEYRGFFAGLSWFCNERHFKLSVEHNRCAARHAHMPMLVYADMQVAAEQVDGYFIVRQSISIGGYRAGASPRTACHGLAAAAFPNPHTQFLPILHAHKLYIRPMREARVFLNTRTRLPHHLVRNLPVHHYHSMRIAHIYDG